MAEAPPPYIQNLQEGESITRCSRCGGVYRGSGISVCAVMHGPDDCCHMGQTMLEPPKWETKRVPLGGHAGGQVKEEGGR